MFDIDTLQDCAPYSVYWYSEKDGASFTVLDNTVFTEGPASVDIYTENGTKAGIYHIEYSVYL